MKIKLYKLKYPNHLFPWHILIPSPLESLHFASFEAALYHLNTLLIKDKYYFDKVKER